jgi:hypothetical protein
VRETGCRLSAEDWVSLDKRREAMRKDRRRRSAGTVNGRPALRTPMIHEGEVARALGQFDGVWDALLPRERSRVFGLLVERVDYEREGQLAVRFRTRVIFSPRQA